MAKKRGGGSRLTSNGHLLNFLLELGHQTAIVLKRETHLSSQEAPAHYKRASENGRNQREVNSMIHKP